MLPTRALFLPALSALVRSQSLQQEICWHPVPPSCTDDHQPACAACSQRSFSSWLQRVSLSVAKLGQWALAVDPLLATLTVPCCCRYVYTPQDVQRMVEDKRSRGLASNRAMHKARLQQQLQHAHDTDNEELAAACAPALPPVGAAAGWVAAGLEEAILGCCIEGQRAFAQGVQKQLAELE